MDDENMSQQGQNRRYRGRGGGGGGAGSSGHQNRNTEGNNNAVGRYQRGAKRGSGATRGNPTKRSRGLLEQQRFSVSDTLMDANDNANNERNDGGGGARRRRRGLQEQQRFSVSDTLMDANDNANNERNDGGGGARRRRRGFQNREGPENESDNESQNNFRGRNNTNKSHCSRALGFKALEEISQAEIKEIILKINERQASFLKVLQSPIDNDKCDIYALLLKIISKVCASSFDELKLKLLLDICNSKFIENLRHYLTDLPYAERKIRNQLYWNNQHEFWDNFITFCECIVNLSPSTALQKCRSLIEGISKICLEELSKRHNFSLPDRKASKIQELRDRLTLHEQEKEAKAIKQKQNAEGEDGEPPDDFRQLVVLPTYEELVVREPFVRHNVVQGGYRDVDHYLDVQFRLLREDCFGPLREGISKFMENPNEQKYDHLKVYRNVKFMDSYINNGKVGSIVQLDQQTMKRFKKVNWAHSKRFIYGSLVLFTKDNCKSFITATILDREPKLITQGKIPVSLVGTASDDIYNGDSYTMIESEVYFEPYYHVLKAMQEPNFAQHLAMQKYIVKVDPIPKPPAYMSPDAVFAVETESSVKVKFQVLQEETWPRNEDINLNESQFDAYKLALTHEFAVIQGPPGTGKTYLGVKVAKTLLENLTPEHGGCLMLVICYTNHALDQFLEAILPVTTSMVRIGGQSRSEQMKEINLSNLRKNAQMKSETKMMFLKQRHVLKDIIRDLQEAHEIINILNNGIISFGDLIRYAPECEAVLNNRKRNNVCLDPLQYWLFENMKLGDFQNALDEYKEEAIEAVCDYDSDEDVFDRIEMILDDFKTDSIAAIDKDSPIHTSFSVKDTEDNLKKLISIYQTLDNRNSQRQLQRKIVDLYSRLHHFNEMSMNRTRDPQTALNTNEVDVSKIPMADRWSYYYKWASEVLNIFKENIGLLQERLVSENKVYEEVRMLMDLQILKGVKVIGMTTSGAARLRKLLEMLSPPIVIVEEAAEVLEQHIVTSLTKNCEHLILIGDHQQLRPSAAYMKLARQYHLEVSLFERMITNGMHSRRLSVQHRMRPEIAALVGTHIYPDLQNHPSVERFPRVRGMLKNMFFLTHNYKEEEVADSSSRSNHKEAELALRLANYLMQQGCYTDTDVTILAAYSGQMFYMRKQREKYRHLARIKITVLDNYQGEESKIIILSLVRNNKNNQIGFLGTENRVCVALSRAREGFYMLGNIEMLKRKAVIWDKIADTLQNKAALGPALHLKCENHEGQIASISSPEDFDKAPEGGCRLKCSYNLACGHQCKLICHGYDRGHENNKCYENCDRILCDKGHSCPRKCWQDCGDCRVEIEKDLPCGHKMMVKCYLDPADPTVKCNTVVTVTLPACKHEAQKLCYIDINQVKCPVPCMTRVDPCGHQCELKCHVRDDPDHEKYFCHKPCAKAKKGCTANLEGDRGLHQCRKMCFESCDDCTVQVDKKRSYCKHKKRVACCEDVDAEQCRESCARAIPGCGHYCKRKCFEACGDCNQMVTKILPECFHEVTLRCKEEPTPGACEHACDRILRCGHKCKERCNKKCDPLSCTEIVAVNFQAPCGHKVEQLPCNVYRIHGAGQDSAEWSEALLRYCNAPCGQELQCGHACAGTCAACRQGRLHAPCAAPCGLPLVCTHRCKEPCSQECPPCRMPCEIRCKHSQCNRLCGESCVSCQEPCSRACPHGACPRRCGEACARAPCAAACALRLACGHACRGLCGEPCPRACRACRPGDFPSGLIEEEIQDHEKLIQLEDCPHIIEVDTLDMLMKIDEKDIKIPTCPWCHKAIINTPRYKDIVNKMFKNKINPVKEKLYGNTEEIKTKKDELILKIDHITANYQYILEEIMCLNRAFTSIRTIVLSQKRVSLSKVTMQAQCLEILDMIMECYQKYKNAGITALRQELLDAIKAVADILVDNIPRKISQQLQMDIRIEIKRMNSIVQLAQIMSHASYRTSMKTTKVMESENRARACVLTWRVFNETAAVAALKELQESVRLSGIVTKQERDLIVKAIDSKAGSWYSCPNGHIYCISACGGAMEVSRCADCGERIGGSNHALLPTNRHAGEVDGSRHAAWSNAYDNMNNFFLN